jgi:glycosyltransferase involved in cell wall biosynthesis
VLHELRPGKTVFLLPAGLNPNRKGADFALRAFAKAADSGLRNAVLAIHSQHPLRDYRWDDPGAPALLENLVRRGLVEVIAQSFEDPRPLYQLGDVCLYPARFDGLGLTIAEANACGLPVIAPDHPPWNEFVTPRNGSLVPCARSYRTDRAFHPFCEIDTDALACELIAWTKRDVSAAKRAAFEFARERLDWNVNASALPDIVASAPLLDKDHAIQAADKYERGRRRSMRQKISFRFPAAVRFARRLYRLKKRSRTRNIR